MEASTREESYVEEEPSSADHYDPYPGEWLASLPHDVVEAQEAESTLQLDIEVAVDVVAVDDDNSPVTPSPSSDISPLSFGIKSNIVNFEPNRLHNESFKHQPRHFYDTHFEHDGSESGHNSEESHSGLPPRSGSRLAKLILGKHNVHEDHEHEHTHRSERRQGWSGEWNAASVQEVIAKLRELK